MDICSFRAGLLAYEGFNRVLETLDYSVAYWPFSLVFWLVVVWTLRAFYVLSSQWSLRAALNVSMSLGVLYLLSPLSAATYLAFLLAILIRVVLEEKNISQAVFRGIFESFIILFPAVIFMNFHVVSCSIQSTNSLWGNWEVAGEIFDDLRRSFFIQHSWLTAVLFVIFYFIGRFDPWQWGTRRIVTAFLTTLMMSLILDQLQVIPGTHVP